VHTRAGGTSTYSARRMKRGLARTRAGRGEDMRHLFVHLAGRNFPFAKISLYLVVPSRLITKIPVPSN
jgi:hypothetical protein